MEIDKCRSSNRCHAYNHKYTFNTKEKVLEQIDKFQVALDQSLFTGKELADGKHTVTVGACRAEQVP